MPTYQNSNDDIREKDEMAQDCNFCFPIDLSKLRTDRLRLVLFDSNINVFSSLFASLTSTPAAVSNYDYLPYGPFETQNAFLDWYNSVIQPSDAVIWFAILVNRDGIESIKQTKGPDTQMWEKDIQETMVSEGEFFAGSVAYLNADVANANCEIGHINILPHFQRTFTTTHASSVLLNYALEPEALGCLQVRRVVWFANASNKRSRAAAERLGFKFEGILRWHRVLPEGKLGAKAGGDGRGPGRDSAIASICWDDWRDGGRDNVKRLLAR